MQENLLEARLINFFRLHLLSAYCVPGSVLGTGATKAIIVSSLHYPLNWILSFFLRKKGNSSFSSFCKM